MTSAQMKAAFKMMQDFAPAIMKASEIFEQLELAEPQLMEHRRTLAAVDAQIEERRAYYDSQYHALVSRNEELSAQLEAKRAEMERGLEHCEQCISDTQKRIAAEEKEFMAAAAEAEQLMTVRKRELADVTDALEAKRKELADFRRSVPKTY